MQMAIYRIRKMGGIAGSKDRKDLQIMEFAARNDVKSLSYKDYKYLRCALQVEEIQKALTGKGLDRKEEFLRAWLAASRTDSQMEQGKKAILCDMVENTPPQARSLLEGEANAKNFRQYFSVREKIGFMIAEFICGFAKDPSRLRFWKNLSAATMLFDTVADFFKDRREGLVKNVRVLDFPILLGRLFSYSIRSISELGIANSVRTLACPVIMTLKGGFEKKSLRNGDWDFTGAIPENTRRTFPFPARGSRI